ncbi:MAG: ribonuclease HI family protein [bacterium]
MSTDPDASLIIYVDGSSRGNPGPAGIGVAVFADDDTSKPIEEISRYIGITTNNVAEYEALIQALRWLLRSEKKSCTIKLDSELVYRQVIGQYRVRKPHIAHQIKRVRRLCEQLGKITFVLIPRDENKNADRLAQKASKKVNPVENSLH